MKSRRLSILLIALAAILSSCKDKTETATPRRYAYPRLETYEADYSRVGAGPVSFEVNTSATVDSPKTGWLNISYPRYGATFYISTVKPDDIAGAIANRRQRMSLNLGGAKATSRSFASGKFECMIVESVDAGTTPVQFLAVGDDGIIVSGTATIGGNTAPADSIRPIVTALADEAFKILTTLQ